MTSAFPDPSTSSPLRVSVIGVGPVGRALANGWARAGHRVTAARRDPSRGRPDALDEGVPVASIDAALEGADAVVLALPARALGSFLAAHGRALGDGCVVDTTNALTGPPMVTANFMGPLHQRSLFQEHAPDARVSRSFCSVAWETSAEPAIDGVVVDGFHAGPQDPTVERLIADLGMRPIWIGDGPHAWDILDGLARLWFQTAVVHRRGRHTGFRFAGPAGAP